MSSDLELSVTDTRKRLPEGGDLPSKAPALLGLFGRNTFWLWLDRGMLSIGTLLAGLILVRYLGPEDYGLYSLALSVGAVSNTLIDFGLTRYAARNVAAFPQEGSSILATAIFSNALLLAAEILGLLVTMIRNEWFPACILAGLVLGNLQRMATLAASFLTAAFRSKNVLLGSLLGRLGTIAVTGIAVWKRLSVLSLLLGISAIWIPVVAVRLMQLRPYWPTRHDWSWKGFRRVVHRAWPFFSYSGTEIGYGQISIICLGLVATRQDVGLFAGALVIASVFPQWTYASVDALLPVVTRLFEAQRIHELLDLRQRLLDVFVIVAVPVVVILTVFAPELCTLLGSRFIPSIVALRIVASRSLLLVLEGLLGGAVLTGMNQVKERRNALALAILLLAPLTLVFGRLWGVAGAAVAILIADIVILLRYVLIFAAMGLKPRLGPGAWSCVLGGVAVAVISAKLASIMGWALTLAPALLVYFLVLALFARRWLTVVGRTVLDCFIGAE